MTKLVYRGPITPVMELHTRRERQRMHFPLRTRWFIVTLKPHATWRSWWHDLVYLVRG